MKLDPFTLSAAWEWHYSRPFPRLPFAWNIILSPYPVLRESTDCHSNRRLPSPSQSTALSSPNGVQKVIKALKRVEVRQSIICRVKEKVRMLRFSDLTDSWWIDRIGVTIRSLTQFQGDDSVTVQREIGVRPSDIHSKNHAFCLLCWASFVVKMVKWTL